MKPASPPAASARVLFVLLMLGVFAFAGTLGIRAAEVGAAETREGPPHWERGLPRDPGFFPIGVWLQDPVHAARYKAAGINLYVGLWKGPTSNQLARLAAAGMRVICEQNALARSRLDDPVIAGWMHGDEPDNAQSLPGGKGYGPPILPAVVLRDYEQLRSSDPTRPVLLNLGQGVAWDDYIGRGVRRNHPEDYPEYLRACDIASFDIYPAVHESPEVAGRLEFVAGGVERLVRWTGGRKVVWNCIECTRISNPRTKPTPGQVRSEVWMSLIRGSRGLIYFVHQFQPEFREAALLDDPGMLAAVTDINRQVRELAPVLNGPDLVDGLVVRGATEGDSIAWIQKQAGPDRYLFAVNLRDRATRARYQWLETDAIPFGGAGGGAQTEAAVEVLGEGRRLVLGGRGFDDAFGPYDVRLYRIPGGRPRG